MMDPIKATGLIARGKSLCTSLCYKSRTQAGMLTGLQPPSHLWPGEQSYTQSRDGWAFPRLTPHRLTRGSLFILLSFLEFFKFIPIHWYWFLIATKQKSKLQTLFCFLRHFQLRLTEFYWSKLGFDLLIKFCLQSVAGDRIWRHGNNKALKYFPPNKKQVRKEPGHHSSTFLMVFICKKWAVRMIQKGKEKHWIYWNVRRR